MAETKLLLPEKTADLSPVQKGWLTMAQMREQTFADLQKHELAVQSKTIAANDQFTYSEVDSVAELNKKLEAGQKLLGEAKQTAALAKETRLFFTNKLKEKIIDKAMEPEKRNDDLIAESGAKEFALRKFTDAKNKEASGKNDEIAKLKAHITNEHFRIATEYRAELKAITLEGYANALKQQQPIDQIEEYKNAIRDFLTQVKLSKFTKFEYRFVTKEEAIAINKEIRPYSSKEDLEIALNGVDEAFIMYEEDLQNAPAAIQNAEREMENAKDEAEDLIETETATNNLVATAEAFTMTGGTAKSTVKESLEIAEVNSDEWAMAVLAAFIKNWGACRKELRVTTWSKLSIGQMAAALGKVATAKQGTAFTGLTLKKKEK